MSFIVNRSLGHYTASRTGRIMMGQRGFVNCVAVCDRIG